MAKPTKKETWVGLLIAVLGVATAYLGYDKATGGSTINIDAGTDHSHVDVVSQNDINSLIKNAIEGQHGKDLKYFKPLESWEK